MTRVFISYARGDDDGFARRLVEILQAAGVEAWVDSESMPSDGRPFTQEIRDAILAADRLLVIFTPLALKSSFVDREWRFAWSEGVAVTPVLRGIAPEDTPATLRRTHAEDCSRIGPDSAVEEFDRLVEIVSAPPAPLGAIVDVPLTPSPYLERPLLSDELVERLIDDPVSPSSEPASHRVVCVAGIPGSGKSVLAAATVRLPDVRRSFPDGVFWISVGQAVTTLELLRRIGAALEVDDLHTFTDEDTARTRLRARLAGSGSLLVLDDLWTAEALETLVLIVGARARILVTSRVRDLFVAAGAEPIEVGQLSAEDGRLLLARWVGSSPEELPEPAGQVVEACGELPLAIAMVGARLAGDPALWTRVVAELEQTGVRGRAPGYEHTSVDRAIEFSMTALQGAQKHRYVDLAVFPEDARLPAELLHQWWQSRGLSASECDGLLDELIRCSLLTSYADGYGLHDLQRDFILRATEDLESLQGEFLDRMGPPGSGAIPCWDAYAYVDAEHHYSEANRAAAWRTLCTGPEWMRRKSIARGFAEVMADMDPFSDDPDLAPIISAARVAAHALAADPDQFHLQLLLRIARDASPAALRFRERLASAADGAPIRTRWASLTDRGGRLVTTFRGREEGGHDGTPRAVDMSRDGRLVVSAGGSSNDLTVKLWHVPTASLLFSLEGVIEPGSFTPLTLLADDAYFAFATSGTVHVHGVESPELPHSIDIGSEFVTCLSAGRTPTEVCIGTKTGRVVIVDSATGEERELRRGDGEPVGGLACAPTSGTLVWCTSTEAVCYDLERFEVVDRVESAQRTLQLTPQCRPSITDGGRRVVLASPAQVWAVGSSDLRPVVPSERHEEPAASSAQGRVLLTREGEAALAIRTLPSGERIGGIVNSREVYATAVCAEGHVAVTGDYEHDLKVWRLDRGRTGEDPAGEPRVTHVAISVDQQHVLVRRYDEPVQVWDLHATSPGVHAHVTPDEFVRRRSGAAGGPTPDSVHAELERIELDDTDGYGHTVLRSAVAPEARIAVSAIGINAKTADAEEGPGSSGSDRDAISFWEFSEDGGEPTRLHRSPGHGSQVTVLALTPDGRRAVSGSSGRVLRVWDVRSGRCLRDLRGHAGSIWCLAVSDDGRLAVSGSEDMTLRFWDLAAGELIATVNLDSGVTACDISIDGTIVVAGDVAGRVHAFEFSGPEDDWD